MVHANIEVYKNYPWNEDTFQTVPRVLDDRGNVSSIAVH